MAISNYATWLDHKQNPNQRIIQTETGIAGVAGRMSSMWTSAPDAGSAPGVAAVPSRTTMGAIQQLNSSGGGDLNFIAASIGAGISGCVLILADRLSHQSGLSGTVTSAQTTNLPTASLTRYTNGVGVWAALEIYSAVGTTSTTVTASYTNQAGTSGKTTVATAFGGTGFREAGRLILLPLALGDTGVRAVASVTLTASTGTAGNFGVTLFKSLAWIPIPYAGTHFDYDAFLDAACVPTIYDDACLWWIHVPNVAASNRLHYELLLREQ